MIITLKLKGQKVVCMIEDGSKVNVIKLGYPAVLKTVNDDSFREEMYVFDTIEIDATSEIKGDK